MKPIAQQSSTEFMARTAVVAIPLVAILVAAAIWQGNAHMRALRSRPDAPISWTSATDELTQPREPRWSATHRRQHCYIAAGCGGSPSDYWRWVHRHPERSQQIGPDQWDWMRAERHRHRWGPNR